MGRCILLLLCLLLYGYPELIRVAPPCREPLLLRRSKRCERAGGEGRHGWHPVVVPLLCLMRPAGTLLRCAGCGCACNPLT